jgi:hypothetical protein
MLLCSIDLCLVVENFIEALTPKNTFFKEKKKVSVSGRQFHRQQRCSKNVFGEFFELCPVFFLTTTTTLLLLLLLSGFAFFYNRLQQRNDVFCPNPLCPTKLVVKK